MTVRRTPLMASFRATADDRRLLDQAQRPAPPLVFREPAYPDGLPYPETAGTDDREGEEEAA